jgi:three-Cys-motif partner protein
MRQSFGGEWTERKLKALGDYLNAYLTIMKRNRRAQFLRTIYLDGFAGSGRRYARQVMDDHATLAELQETETQEFYKGSARRALELAKPFDQYIFVEIDDEAAKELRDLCAEFPQRCTRVEAMDANAFIPEWCRQLQPQDRGLVFLDPYGMQVRWGTMESLANTLRVDVWVLVPLGQAIVRLLPQREPPEKWAAALTLFFGTEDWKDHFYTTKEADTLFGRAEAQEREVDYVRVTRFIVDRFRTIFNAVLEEPVLLRNSRGIPLYLLCFAASNPKGAPTALRIAKDIARSLNDGGQ